MNVIIIDAGAYARAALDALSEGRMGFQSGTSRAEGGCRYLYRDGSRCAIGAGLPVEPLSRLDRYQISAPVGTLLRTGVLAITSDRMAQAELRPLLGLIQATHDGLMLKGLTPEQTAGKVAALTALLTGLAERHAPVTDRAG